MMSGMLSCLPSGDGLKREVTTAYGCHFGQSNLPLFPPDSKDSMELDGELENN